MLQCIVYNIIFFQHLETPCAGRKRTFSMKKLNMKNYDEAQDRQIEDAVRTVVKTHGLKRAKSESLEDKKPEII